MTLVQGLWSTCVHGHFFSRVLLLVDLHQICSLMMCRVSTPPCVQMPRGVIIIKPGRGCYNLIAENMLDPESYGVGKTACSWKYFRQII